MAGTSDEVGGGRVVIDQDAKGICGEAGRARRRSSAGSSHVPVGRPVGLAETRSATGAGGRKARGGRRVGSCRLVPLPLLGQWNGAGLRNHARCRWMGRCRTGERRGGSNLLLAQLRVLGACWLVRSYRMRRYHRPIGLCGSGCFRRRP